MDWQSQKNILSITGLLNTKTGNSIQAAFSFISISNESCLIAGSVSTLAMLKSEQEPNWLEDSDLPFLTVDQNMQLGGTLNNV